MDAHAGRKFCAAICCRRLDRAECHLAPVQVTAGYDFMTEGVLITSPYDGESVYVNTLTLIALDFDDPLGVFEYAEFFANNASLGQTTNTTFNWAPSTTNDYVLSATIYDIFGTAYSATNAVTVHVILPPRPVVTITSPAAGSRLRAAAESFIIASLDDPGQLTTNVQFYVDGAKISDNTSYYSWTPTQLGGHALQAVALTSDGDSIASPIVNVTVAKMSPPVVNILSPTNGQLFTSGTVPVVNAQATDSDAPITNLTLTLDSAILDQTSAAALAVATTNITSGWHEAVAQATDNNGLSASSAVISFFVDRGENEALPVPDQLAVTALSATQIQLSWSPIATNELTQNILVQRWDPLNLLWSEIADIPVASTNYLDSALDPETNYRYRIACADVKGNRSAYTAETNATTRTVVPNYAVLDLSTSVSSCSRTSCQAEIFSPAPASRNSISGELCHSEHFMHNPSLAPTRPPSAMPWLASQNDGRKSNSILTQFCSHPIPSCLALVI